jgi:hypothetical protein
MGRTSPDISGQRFGHWTALHRDGYIYGKQIAWVCRCDCGTLSLLGGSNLRRGETTNCGCQQRKALGDRARKHGKITHRLYRTWLAMHDRCRRPAHEAYPRYGGRGIAVCAAWGDFDAFLADMEASWRPGLTLDRKDNDGPYSPDNCWWASKHEQARNKANTRFLTFNGETRPLAAWAELLGLTRPALETRLRKGWDLERAMTTPPKSRIRRTS